MILDYYTNFGLHSDLLASWRGKLEKEHDLELADEKSELDAVEVEENNSDVEAELLENEKESHYSEEQ